VATIGILWFLIVGLGLVMSLGAPLLSGVEAGSRQAYGAAVTVELLAAAGGFGAIALTRDWGADAVPFIVGILLVTLASAVALTLAVRSERRRDGVGWVPTAAMAAFPVFLVYCFVFAAMLGG